jgi:hypothetical protein
MAAVAMVQLELDKELTEQPIRAAVQVVEQTKQAQMVNLAVRELLL